MESLEESNKRQRALRLPRVARKDDKVNLYIELGHTGAEIDLTREEAENLAKQLRDALDD